MSPPRSYDRSLVREALAQLGIDRLVLAIHDASFPSLPHEELGRGSPYSEGGRAFLSFVQQLGFDGVLFGPQGQTSAANPSPYDGAVFSRNLMSLAPSPLTSGPRPLVPPERLARWVAEAQVNHAGQARNRVAYASAWQGAQRLLDVAYETYRRGEDAELCRAFESDRARRLAPGSWLEKDALFTVLSALHASDDWRRWPEPDRSLYREDAFSSADKRQRRQALLATQAPAIERYALGQFLLQRQHDELRRDLAGLRLFGDLQVGYAHSDVWAHGSVFLPGYEMGAPPSRTNPDGQPWGYPVLDPRLYGDPAVPGPALALVTERVDKLLTDFDGLRIDHPHGLVCPWVYMAGTADPAQAVQRGARLFSSPAVPDHPALGPFSLVRPEQLNPDPHTPRHADDWVIALEPAQTKRYAVVLDALLARAQARGRRRHDILCEVLSTWPFPLETVMRERALGRFCVTQKANPETSHDVYDSARLEPNDWIMVGTHDTPPLWALAPAWQGTRKLELRALHLARRLVPDDRARPAFAEELLGDPRALCNALFAELFASPARNVSVFFADLLGQTETYNRPGVKDALNWTLRVPPDFAGVYEARTARGEALDLRRALALALRAKQPTAEGLALATKLEQRAGPLPPP